MGYETRVACTAFARTEENKTHSTANEKIPARNATNARAQSSWRMANRYSRSPESIRTEHWRATRHLEMFNVLSLCVAVKLFASDMISISLAFPIARTPAPRQTRSPRRDNFLACHLYIQHKTFKGKKH